MMVVMRMLYCNYTELHSQRANKVVLVRHPELGFVHLSTLCTLLSCRACNLLHFETYHFLIGSRVKHNQQLAVFMICSQAYACDIILNHKVTSLPLWKPLR